MSVYSGDTSIKIGDEIWKKRPWALDPMKLGVARSWLRRQFNLALRAAPKNAVVVGRLDLRQAREPYGGSSGTLSGVNGRLMREDGIMERYL